MIINLKRWRRLTFYFAALFVVSLISPPSAHAQGLNIRDRIYSGEVLDEDIILNGDLVIMSGTVNGDVFAAGKQVVISGTVNGSLFVIGDQVEILGTVEDSVYVTAVTLDLKSTSKIGRSVYFLGVSLLTEKDSFIERDLNGISLGARLAGTVNGNSQVIVGLVELGKLILDSINRVTTGIPIGAVIPSAAPTHPIAQARELQIMAGSAVPLTQDDGAVDPDPVDPGTAALNWTGDRLRMLISLLVVGAFFIWLLPKWLEKWADKVGERPFGSTGWGLGIYIVGFIGFFIVLLIFIAIGISLAVMTLWGLAFTFWGLALSSLSLAFAIFLLFVSYGSKIIVAFVCGRWLFKRLYPRANKHKLWPLLLGLLLYVLVYAIPFLGWAISLIVTFIGLGAVWLVYQDWANGRSAKPDAV